MSQIYLPYPNDNVWEERIEWDGIANRKRRRCCSVLETRLMINVTNHSRRGRVVYKVGLVVACNSFFLMYQFSSLSL